MSFPVAARAPVPIALQRSWRWTLLLLAALVPRLYLLRAYDVELSQDGFDAVNTLTILQTRGASAVPRELLDRMILHPLYMLLLLALRLVTPAALDFYVVARLFSALLACVAVLLMFEFVRRSFGEYAAWSAALLLALAPSFLWESAAILSSTLFLALYLAVLLALWQSRYRLAALLAFLSAITRYEGVVLIALVFLALAVRDARARQFRSGDWLVCGAWALAFPLTLIVGGALATGNALEFLGAQSMASIWLRFLAPGDFWKRGAFFVTQYPALFPLPIVWLGVAGATVAAWQVRARGATGEVMRAAALWFAVAALYVLFFEALVWFNYTTLEVRFLMYPGLALLVFAAVALAAARRYALRFSRAGIEMTIGGVLAILLAMSYQQGIAGIQFVYNMQSSQREVVEELAPLIPARQPTNLMMYGGVAGALDYYARPHGLDLASTDFRFVPDEQPEQYLIDRKIRFIIYPVGNAFAKAKYPYLARFETQTHGPVTFQALTQFATSPDNQLYSIWAVSPAP